MNELSGTRSRGASNLKLTSHLGRLVVGIAATDSQSQLIEATFRSVGATDGNGAESVDVTVTTVLNGSRAPDRVPTLNVVPPCVLDAQRALSLVDEQVLQGALCRDEVGDKLVSATLATAAGLSVVSPGVRSRAAMATNISDRQMDVLCLASRGLTNAGISDELHVSKATVKRDLRGLFEEFGAANRVELVALAIGQGHVRPLGE